jgi:predicted acetyltransferase
VERGTSGLPSFCLGHIGYLVVPWKNADDTPLRLCDAASEGEAGGTDVRRIVTDVDNITSQRVIEANGGGVLVERFDESTPYGGKGILRYRVNREPQSLLANCDHSA